MAGIVLVAVAMKTTLANFGDELDTIPAFGLCGGSAIYLLTFAAIRIRTTRRISRGRSITAVAFLVLFPIATAVPALVALALASAVWVSLHAYELDLVERGARGDRALRAPTHP